MGVDFDKCFMCGDIAGSDAFEWCIINQLVEMRICSICMKWTYVHCFTNIDYDASCGEGWITLDADDEFINTYNVIVKEKLNDLQERLDDLE